MKSGGGVAQGGAGGHQQAGPPACQGRGQGRGGDSPAPEAEAGGGPAQGQRGALGQQGA